MCLLLLLLHLLQLEEWEADPSAGQLQLVEAVREVLSALLKDLTRNNRCERHAQQAVGLALHDSALAHSTD